MNSDGWSSVYTLLIDANKNSIWSFIWRFVSDAGLHSSHFWDCEQHHKGQLECSDELILLRESNESSWYANLTSGTGYGSFSLSLAICNIKGLKEWWKLISCRKIIKYTILILRFILNFIKLEVICILLHLCSVELNSVTPKINLKAINNL